jgi:hypothetical protein
MPLESTVHLQSSPWPRGYTLLSPSLHSQCAVGRPRDRIAEVLGLPEYPISCKVSTKQAYDERSSTDTIRDTTLGLLSRCKSTELLMINYWSQLSSKCTNRSNHMWPSQCHICLNQILNYKFILINLPIWIQIWIGKFRTSFGTQIQPQTWSSFLNVALEFIPYTWH